MAPPPPPPPVEASLPRHSNVLYSPSTEHPPSSPLMRRSSDLPTSPLHRRPVSPALSRRPTSVRSQSYNRRTFYGRVLYRMSRIRKGLRKQIRKLPWWQRIGILLAITIFAAGAILLAVFHTRILNAFVEPAKKIRTWKAGWLVPFAVCFFSAFPPIFGYSTSITIAGFIYGLPTGWYIEAGATLTGSLTAFLLSRYFFRDFAARMVKRDPRFAALSLTLKHDGLKLLCMIRLCPLPYSISNVAISSFPTVSPLHFFLATLVATPKLAIGIFIGGRLYDIAESGEKMDMKTRMINYFSIIGGLILGAVTGWLIYKRTSARARFLEMEERARIAREALPGYVDDESEDDEEDLRASSAARWIADLLEGESDDEEGDEEEQLITVNNSDEELSQDDREDLLEIMHNADKQKSQKVTK